MEAKLMHDLGFEKNDRQSVKENPNRSNGSTSKTLRSNHGAINLKIARDRELEFEEQIVKNLQQN